MDDQVTDDIAKLAAGVRIAKSDHPDYLQEELQRVGIPYPSTSIDWQSLLDKCNFAASEIDAVLSELGYPGYGPRIGELKPAYVSLPAPGKMIDGGYVPGMDGNTIPRFTSRLLLALRDMPSKDVGDQHGPHKQSSDRLTLEVSREPPQVRLNGVTYRLDFDAANFLCLIVEGGLQNVSLSDIYPKPKRQCDKLPEEIRSLIRSTRGAGWSIDRSVDASAR